METTVSLINPSLGVGSGPIKKYEKR